MTTDELLWNNTFEHADSPNSGEEQWQEKYYEEKELFEKLSELLGPAE